MRTNLNGKQISEVNDLNTQGKVNLDPDYQRRPVWSFKSKVYLIDTILQNLPIPKFFIQNKVDLSTGKSIYDVVDGQQRLTAIFELIAGQTSDDKPREFILSKKQHPKPETFPDRLEGLSFKSLPEDLLKTFWTYKLSFEELEDASEQEIKDMFIRLNLSGAKLNPQELRNAAYNGDFKQMVYSLADEYDDYLVDNKILSASSVKRMGDAEFVSELMAAMVRGLQDKKKSLNQIYADLDSMDDDDVNEWKKSFRSTMSVLDKILDEDIKSTRFKNKNDFYSLFYVLFDLKSNKNYKIDSSLHAPMKDVLIELSKNVFLESPNPRMVTYHDSASNAGDTIKNRRYRHEILLELLEPFCIKRDERRNFSEFERQFLWHSSTEKKCKICDREIDSYDDYQIDHKIAWDNGGLTNLGNAQLAHRACNQAKGNR